jgi:hypothetical protein
MIGNTLKCALALGLVLAPVSALASYGAASPNSAYADQSFSGASQSAANSGASPIAFNDLRHCPRGQHSQSFPNQAGWRCVVNRR